MAKSISNTVLQMVLSQANKEQNQHYPPSVFESHYQLVTNWLIDECVKLYPGTRSIEDLIGPYLNIQLIKVVNGIIPFPKEYRNLLNFGLYLNDAEQIPDECKKLPDDVSEDELKQIIARTQSSSWDVTDVSIGRWNKLTKHRYKRPTLTDPITCRFTGTGIKICPFDVPFVEERFIVKTPDFKYGYGTNDDDTYYFDPDVTTEALWTENAISYLFKGVNKLYSNFVKDPEHAASSTDLRDSGLF